MSEFNPSSPQQISLLLFGGTVKEFVNEPILNELGAPVTIKTGQNRGQIKTKRVEKLVSIQGLGLKPHKDWKTKREGVFQTNEKVLKTIAGRDKTEAGKIAKLMLEIREKEKLMGTYYEGVEKFIHTDSCVHPCFQHVSSDTGRTSCNKPNMQQIPR